MKTSLKLYLLSISIALVFVGVIWTIYLNVSTSKPEPVLVETVAPTPTSVVKDSPTGNQKIYFNRDFVYPNSIYEGYSFSYPETCTLSESQLNCQLGSGTAIIYINARNNSSKTSQEVFLMNNSLRSYAFGSGKMTFINDPETKLISGTYWINKTPLLTNEQIFGFGFEQIPEKNYSEFFGTFEKIISSFSFTELSNKPSPEN